MARKTQNLTLRGQEIRLRDLQSIMPRSHALVVSKLLYFVENKKFIVYEGGNQYVRKSLKEWSEDLELWLVNGKKRQIAKSTVCGIFKELINTGIVTYINCYSKIRAYSVCEEVLIQMLREKIGLEFESNSEHLYHRTLEQKNNKTKRDVNRSEHSDKNETELNCTKNIGMLNETEQELNTKTIAQQGVDSNLRPGTYTYTNTYTNNKSHKSEASDLREKITIKKQVRNSDLRTNEQQNQTENLFQNYKSDKSNKSISEEDNFIKNNKRDSELFQQSATQTTTNDASNEKIAYKKESSCSKQKSTIVQDMFAIWQDEFPLLEEQLNLEKSSWLKSAYDSVFNKDLQEFRTYLRRVKTSSFIVEKPHLLNMKWLLDFEQISAIRAGNYNTCDPDNPSVELRNFKIDCRDRIEAKRGPWTCESVSVRMLEKLGPHLYTQWFCSLHMEINDESGKLDCMDFYFNRKPNAANYANAMRQELQAEENARLEQIQKEQNEKLFEQRAVNTQDHSNDDIVKIDINQFCKPRTVNPRPPAKPEEIQIVPGVAEKIMKIWNASIKEKYRENLNEEKIKMLNQVFVNSFDKDYEQVEEFMETLKRTMLYRTRPYMLNVLWILDADTIRQIRGGFLNLPMLHDCIKFLKIKKTKF